jgi:hypothetical protein
MLKKKTPLYLVSIDTHPYTHSHSKEPKGSGHWVFQIHGHEYAYNGLYGECSKYARQKAAVLGHTRIVLMS